MPDSSNRKAVKLSLLFLITLLSGIPLAVNFSRAFLENEGIFSLFSGLSSVTTFAFYLTIFLIPLCISAIFTVKNSEKVILSMLVPIFFLIGINQVKVDLDVLQVIIISIICALGTFVFLNSLQGDLSSFTKFKIRRLFSPNIKLFITFLALSIATVIYTNLSEVVKREGIKLPVNIMDNLISGPLSEMFREQISDQIGRSTEQNISPEEVFDLLQQEIPETLQEGQLRQELIPENFQSLLVPAPQGMLQDIGDQVVNDFENFLKPYSALILLLASLGIFWFIQITGFLVSIIVLPLISAIFYILTKINFVSMEEKNVMVQLPTLT